MATFNGTLNFVLWVSLCTTPFFFQFYIFFLYLMLTNKILCFMSEMYSKPQTLWLTDPISHTAKLPNNPFYFISIKDMLIIRIIVFKCHCVNDGLNISLMFKCAVLAINIQAKSELNYV